MIAFVFVYVFYMYFEAPKLNVMRQIKLGKETHLKILYFKRKSTKVSTSIHICLEDLEEEEEEEEERGRVVLLFKIYSSNRK